MMARVRQRAGLWSLAAGAAVAVCGFFLLRGMPLQTDLLALLPATERDPVAEQAVATLNRTHGSRLVFLVSHQQEDSARMAAAEFATALRGHTVFQQVSARLPPADPAVPMALFGPHRFGLLSAADRAELAAGGFDADAALLRRLISPLAFTTPLAEDPFGFFAHWLATLPQGVGSLTLRDGWLITQDDGRTHVLVLAHLNGSSFDNATQTAAIDAYTTARQSLLDNHPDAAVLRTGTLFYAAAARSDAQTEMHRIGMGSLLGITLLFYLVFRSLRALVLGLLSVAIGVAVATSTILLSQGQLHLITLIFGAALIGEAIDYAIQYLAVHLDEGPRWQAEAGLARIRPALGLAVATSLLSYALLGLLPFPGIAQIALFALAGLGAAYLSVLWLLPALLSRPATRDPLTATAWAAQLLERWSALFRGRRALWICALVVLVSLPGWRQLSVDDDVRLLVTRPAALVAEEDQIRRLAGFDASSRFFLVRGNDAAQVLERETALVEQLRALEQEGVLKGHQAVSDFVPPPTRQTGDRDLLARTLFASPEKLKTTLASAGFQPQTATALLSAFRNTTPLTPQDWLQSPLSLPYRHLWQPAGDAVAASIVTLAGERHSARLAEATRALPGVTLVDKAGSVSALLGRYRHWGGPVLAVMAGVIFLVLTWRYPLAAAARIMLPVVLAEGLSIGVFGYLGEAVTLFAILGWGLTLGVGVNYAIFLHAGRQRAPATTAGVLISAATTLLSFGLLTLSSMPALHQFGLALFTGISCAVLLVPLVLQQKTLA